MSFRSILLFASVALASGTNSMYISLSQDAKHKVNEVQEGMRAFGEFPESRLVDIPDELVNSDHDMVTFGRRVKKNTQFTFQCPAKIEGDMCFVYVFTYHCPPCALHGGLPSVLMADGWEAGSCAPHFILEKDGEKHEMAAFRKQVDRTKRLKFKVSEEAQFVAMIATQYGVRCGDEKSELTCRNTRHCAWDQGKCVDSWCPRRHLPTLAPVVCDTCAGEAHVTPVAEPVPIAPDDPPTQCKHKLYSGQYCATKETCCAGSLQCKWVWCKTQWFQKCK